MCDSDIRVTDLKVKKARKGRHMSVADCIYFIGGSGRPAI